jgi:hypothetical protein
MFAQAPIGQVEGAKVLRRCHARLERVAPGLGACCVKALLLALMVAPVHAAPQLALQAASEGRVIARTADGSIAWQVDRTRGGPLTYEVDARGRSLIDGTLLVDRWGQVVARVGEEIDAAPSTASSTDTLGWDSPVQISAEPAFEYGVYTPALIDSAGNAWVILHGTGFSDSVIQVTGSAGHGGAWTPPETLYSAPGSTFPPASVIDANDRITVAYREIVGSMDELRVLRYVPAVGWSGPVTIYSADNATNMFQNVYAAIDAQGNVVVCFDGENRTAMYVVVYNAATDTWSEPTRISPTAAAHVRLPTLIQNRAGTSLYALYLVDSNPGRGLYLRRFRSATLDWTPPRRVPGTASAQIPGGSQTGSRIPATVDDQGNVTVPFYVTLLRPPNMLQLLRAAHLEMGVWAAPVTVMTRAGNASNLPSLTDFADMDYGAEGDVFMVFPRSSSQTLRQAFHYNASTLAWDAPVTLFADPQSGQTRMRVAARSDGSAIATFLARSTEAYFSSRLFSAGVWLPDVFAIPGDPAASFHETTADGLDVIMVYGAPFDFPAEFATWFRESAFNAATLGRR